MWKTHYRDWVFILLLKVICALFLWDFFPFCYCFWHVGLSSLTGDQTYIPPTLEGEVLTTGHSGESLKALFEAQAFCCPFLLEAEFYLPFLLSTAGLERTNWNIRMCEAAVTPTAQNPWYFLDEHKRKKFTLCFKILKTFQQNEMC